MSSPFSFHALIRASLLVCLTSTSFFSTVAYAIVDFDADGRSDIWELAYGQDYEPTLDNDGDGRTNSEEHNDGTDPRDAASVRPVPAVQNVSRFGLRFAWPTVSGKSYQLQVSFDGAAWTNLGAPIIGNQETVQCLFDTRKTYLGTGPQLDRYTNLSGAGNLDDLKAAISKTAPTETRLLNSVETAQSDPDIDYYGERIRGWLIPPADGSYVFSLAGDLVTEFSLSANSSPLRLAVLAYNETATGFREWDKTSTQKSEPVVLKRGRLYYFEAYQKGTTGNDHVSVAWAGPGLGSSSEVILGAYVTATGQSYYKVSARGGRPTFRLLVSDRDSDNDGLTDYEERIAGLDPTNPATVSRIADMVTIRSRLAEVNTLTVGAGVSRGYEAERRPAQFTFLRWGNINPLTVRFTVNGTALSGMDFAPLSGVVEFGVGQTSANVDLLPDKDGIFESAESVTATLVPDEGYVVGTPDSATVTIDDGADTVFIATLQPAGTKSGGYGTAALRVSGNEAFGTLSLTFGNLTSTQTGAEFYILGAAHRTTTALGFPPGQVASENWALKSTGNVPAERVLAALKSGRLGARVKTTRFPNGEINGLFVKNWGWRKMAKPMPPGPALARARTEGDAARFLTQATFGATTDSIALVKRMGFAAWIDSQLKSPPTLHLPYVQKRREEILIRTEGNDDGHQGPRQEAWWQAALTAPDQLRQRMAFALSEILVVSDIGALEGSHEGMTNYYDLLVKHAFGNYRDLLEAVTLSPMMGQYLSMARNEKPNPTTGSEPDENYAREICQLFTIGLNQLNMDGSLRLSADGLPIPAYTQQDVVGLAHVFTGWGFAYDPLDPPDDLRSYFRFGGTDEIRPMIFYPDFHDTGAKRIVRGVDIPANLSGLKELKLALDVLFHHPNVGPFLAQRLIQRFVTSNPSRGYTFRVASVFNNNGQGIRGDLGATLRAVLLDPEARNPVFGRHASYGKLREPILRVSALLRAFKPAPPFARDARYFIDLRSSITNQAPLKAPSVFNFFQPGYSRPGRIAAAGLFSPEFQITSETSVISFTNVIDGIIQNGIATSETARVELAFGSFGALLERREGTPEVSQSVMIESLNALLLGGRMSAGLAQSIRDALDSLPASFGGMRALQRERLRMAVYIITASPEFSVQK